MQRRRPRRRSPGRPIRARRLPRPAAASWCTASWRQRLTPQSFGRRTCWTSHPRSGPPTRCALHHAPTASLMGADLAMMDRVTVHLCTRQAISIQQFSSGLPDTAVKNCCLVANGCSVAVSEEASRLSMCQPFCYPESQDGSSVMLHSSLQLPCCHSCIRISQLTAGSQAT